MRYLPDREQAIEDLLAVANTEHTAEAVFPIRPDTELSERYDHLRSGEAAAAYLRRKSGSVPRTIPTRGELVVLRQLRAAMRALVRGEMAEHRRRFMVLARRYRYHIDERGFAADADGWLGFVAALLPAVRDLAADHERLRACGNCEWLFYDRSRQGRKVWCDTAACGNRVKVRRFRERLQLRPRRSRPLRSRT